MKLLICSEPFKGESLSSYLQRLSELNYVTSHDIWRLFLRHSSHYPQSSISAALDICPDSFFELGKLGQLIDLPEYSLKHLTFIPVFKKFGIMETTIHHSRVLSNMIENNRKFCPKCIEVNSSYKIIWQVKEVNYCPIHNIKLHLYCNHCNKKIPICPSKSKITICPNCNSSLITTPAQPYRVSSTDLRIIDDWTYLLDSSTANIKLINELSSEQSLALRLLFITHNYKNKIDQSEQRTLSSIMQIARNSKVAQTFIHLRTVFHFIRKFNISMQEFLSFEVPINFTNSILNQKIKLIENYSCLAPWCNHFQIPGSLERTSTSLKAQKSGQNIKYYMFCNDCGTEYGLTKYNNKLVERGYFIDLAWEKVKNNLKKGEKFTVLAKKINTTNDKLRRAIIFLAANNLIELNQVPIEIPSTHDSKKLLDMKNLINQGLPAKHIQKILCLKYNDFLFYWLSREIRKEYLKNIIKRPCIFDFGTERKQKFENAINKLLSKNNPITVKAICKELNVCPETLRNWGFLSSVKKYKSLQINKLQEEFKNSIILKTDEVLTTLLLKGTQIFSDDLYKSLGIRRTVLVRKYPELTKEIYIKLMNAKKSLL
jgi:hypothetical protein